MANALSSVIVAPMFMRREGSVKHFIQMMMVGETVNLVGRHEIVAMLMNFKQIPQTCRILPREYRLNRITGMMTFFPEVFEPKGIMLNVLDLEGKEWEFSFRYWPNCGSRTYVLEGLREIMVSRKLQAGDTGNSMV
ncbi:hypothetical protein Ccrd_022671, partial [Cynara cardunculus var. scolymus]